MTGRNHSAKVTKLVAPETELQKITRLVLTPQCNLRCFFCHNEGAADIYFRNYLPLDKLLSILEILHANGVQGVSLTGGEPLLYKDFVRLARHAVELFEPTYVHLTTNGVLLQENSSFITKMRLGRVNVSIPSINRAKYASITGVDALPYVVSGVENLALEDSPSVHVNVAVSQGLNDSEAEIRELLEFWSKRKIHLDLVMLYPWPRKLPRSKVIQGAAVRRLLERVSGGGGKVSFGHFRAPVSRYEYGKLKVSLRDYVAERDVPICMACKSRSKCLEGINSPRLYLDGKIKPCLLGDPIDLLEDAMQGNWPTVEAKIGALERIYESNLLTWKRR